MKEQTLYLIDGHSLTFKAYYAIRNLRSPQGEPTGAVYGFLRMMLRYIDDWSPEYLAVVFDTGKPSFRRDLYEPYKANRQAPPPDFEVQMRMIYRLLKAMGIAVYDLDGFEADDVIATMAEKVKTRGSSAVILSADKDLLQLVDEHVEVLRPGNNETKRCDTAEVEQILGVRPDQVVDYLALVGDSSDNIPGVPGIGEKSAIELLRQYGTLEELIANADKLAKPRQRAALKEYSERALLARQLATVRRDAPIQWDIEACRLPPNPWSEPMKILLIELGFQSILKERGIAPPEPPAAADRMADPLEPVIASQPPIHYAVLSEEAALREWVEEGMRQDWVALDTETTSTDAMRCELVGISLSNQPGKAIYIPVGHQSGLGESPQIPLARVREILKPLLGGKGPRLAAHHAKFDWKVLRRAGFRPAAPGFDTMIASYLMDPDKATGHGLKALGREECGIIMQPISELIGKGNKAITMAEVAVEDAGPYACADADVTLRLSEKLRPRLGENPKLAQLMNEIEMPLVMVLLEMEMGGFTVEMECLRQLGGQLSRLLTELGRRIWDKAGHPFNIGSPRQVAQLLYQDLGLKTGKRGKTGYSTDEAELERLAAEHEIPRLILEYRGYEKLKSTYIDALPKLVNPRTGRIHTSFNQTIAATGRLTSTDPNLQNIPIRTELGRSIRKAFVADGPGHELLKADYSQIELRILAHMSRDGALCDAYQEGRDIHRQTASEIFGVPLAKVTAPMRAQAKTINFGVIYGMSAHGLAQQLGISRARAADFIARYFQTYPGVREWIDRLLTAARQTGWVETLLGRRRLAPDLTVKNGLLRGNAERIAVNAPIQGTCADMIKRAMIAIHQGLGEVAPEARMVCQVHDELVFSVPRERLAAAGDFIRRRMTQALPLSVPVEVEISHAANWAEC